ncbi:hypothetical protein DFJ74DRAFT_652608 [Hyaloraphidium curvatum]|nr:hypothetical protein DFJ74DRAFT_652608 [Hyaloraphidium curvatum]
MRVLLGTRILEALSADISVDLGVRHLVRARLPHLKCLKIRIGEFESGYNPASLSGFPVLPSLERLELGGDVPWRFLFVLAKRCPKLEQIDLRAKLADVEDNWHLIPGHILAKITSLTAYPDQLASIRTTSALRPRVLRNGDHIDHTTLENLRMLLLHVQSIEELHVHQYIGVHTPVSDFLLLPALASLSCVEILEVRVLARLLPPTLRSLSVKVLKWHTPLDEPDNLDRLLRSLSDPSGLRLSIQCLSCVIEGRPRRFQAQQSLSKLRELVGTGVPEGTQVEGLEALEAAGDLSYRED